MSEQATPLRSMTVRPEIALIKRVDHPEFGEVIELPNGQIAVPVEVCSELVSQQQEALSEKLADVEEKVQALQCEVDEARSQHTHVMNNLPEGNVFGDAQKRHLQGEVERTVAQLNEAHGVLATIMESVSSLADQVMDGVAVVVSEKNEHGKGLIEVMESIDNYTETFVPKVEFA